MIYEEIKQLRLNARKNRNEAETTALTYIQGELERKEKNPTDEASLKILKKVEAALQESNDTFALSILQEILNKYTPKQLSEAEIKEIISTLTGKPSLGEVQKYFKENYTGKYDGGTVTRIYKEG